MANLIGLNPVSYHGTGAVAEAANELAARGYKKPWSVVPVLKKSFARTKDVSASFTVKSTVHLSKEYPG